MRRSKRNAGRERVSCVHSDGSDSSVAGIHGQVRCSCVRGECVTVHFSMLDIPKIEY